ncbi:putative glycine dehydrogenase (decarboxylating) [Paramyrothecium foliicola]|nr:putative glycine dehydrogenase (decarboxylating) [Paramyrothecium foliicola]
MAPTPRLRSSALAPIPTFVAFVGLVLSGVAAQSSNQCDINNLETSYPAPVTADGWSHRLVASGLSSPRSILFDSEGGLIVVEQGTGIVHLALEDQGRTCLRVSRQTTLIEDEGLNHGLALSEDGRTLYASTQSDVYSWPYDPSGPSLNSDSRRTLVNNMGNRGHTTRTLMLSRQNPDILLVSLGSGSNQDVEALNITTGISQIRSFNISALGENDDPYDYTNGNVLGWGLRNSVGIGEHPGTGGIWSVENSVDNLFRQGEDIHNENPAEELNFHGYLNGSEEDQGGNYGYPQCYTIWSTEDFPDQGDLRPGDAFHADWQGQSPRNLSTPTDEQCNTEHVPAVLGFVAHTAPLDIKFNGNGTRAYISFHGSWNRDEPAGYEVSYVAFNNDNGRPTANQDSTDAANRIIYNTDVSNCPDNCFRPAGLAFDSSGRLWFSSDSTGEIFVLEQDNSTSDGEGNGQGGDGGSGDDDGGSGLISSSSQHATAAMLPTVRSARIARRQCGRAILSAAARRTPCPYTAFSAQAAARSQSTTSFASVPSSVAIRDHERFSRRHNGSEPDEHVEMLKALVPPVSSMEEFIQQTIPPQVRRKEAGLRLVEQRDTDAEPTPIPADGYPEHVVKERLNKLAELNVQNESFIGSGYYGTLVPPVIQRNILENPAWYTSYTPYQAEISQGRLESLLNFQTLVSEMTGLAIANASVLDESTAAAEAMTMAWANAPAKAANKTFVVSENCHPQTLAVLQSRAEGFGIEIVVGDVLKDNSALIRENAGTLIGTLIQYPDTHGGVFDYQQLSDLVHEKKGLVCVATDLLALTRLKAPGEFGADIAVGSAQRLGVPLGYGGPHAGFFACADKYKRKIPGRIVGVSKDRLNNRALRLALQTREQHIRREKATSNICTAQALLANMSAFYAIYHGPEGLKAIAEDIASKTRLVQELILQEGAFKTFTSGVQEDGSVLFDTVTLQGTPEAVSEAHKKASAAEINLRQVAEDKIGFSLHEGISVETLGRLVQCFGVSEQKFTSAVEAGSSAVNNTIPVNLQRQSTYLQQPVFNKYHTETELLRYIYHLGAKDLSLVHSMIPLGSCTMKLNATTEMQPVSQPGFSNIHPFAPVNQTPGYQALIDTVSQNLATVTGMDKISLQPNSGAQGEFAGLRVIQRYHEEKDGNSKRDICLIPVSAHGTNPASAAMAGMKVVSIKCDTQTGNLDIADLKAKCEKHADQLAAIMVTYPSTFGVFEPEVKEVCRIVHEHGGQVYMDGANLNAQIGLCSPGDIGADVCHLNLHKTFCIPHGGGGPGVGPIGVKEHLAPYLPGHPVVDPQHGGVARESTAVAPISAAPWGSASILPITHSYIQLMGGDGLTKQTGVALLNANYIMSRLHLHYKIVYTNSNGRCAHEFILDARPFKETAGIEAVDIAKRLQDYGFHAPTMSWPVSGTLMIEPTESESRAELDRFCDAFIQIRKEIADIESGKVPRTNNVLKNAPHPQQDLLRAEWDRPYTREQAAYPLGWLREKKFWPSVARVDDAFGDSNLFCTCPPVEDSE